MPTLARDALEVALVVALGGMVVGALARWRAGWLRPPRCPACGRIRSRAYPACPGCGAT